MFYINELNQRREVKRAPRLGSLRIGTKLALFITDTRKVRGPNLRRLYTVTKTNQAPYPECHKCPLYQYQECTIESSRILTYYYCPVSEGFLQHETSSHYQNETWGAAAPAA